MTNGRRAIDVQRNAAPDEDTQADRRHGIAFIDRFGGEHFDPAKDRGKGKCRDYWMRDTWAT
jgi:hypothetical protein